ncbi:MAG: leucine-rich repeat domain-containing protein [Verrucomicrobia bacterium]|nr:leucine-rich repeat domain-containing protein [Verrucomicrobiota bacterium]
MKKVLNLIMVAVLTTAATSTALQFGDFIYSDYSGEIWITGYTGLGGAVDIPATIDGLPVVGIQYRAFDDCSDLTSITIPDSVTAIGNSAFKHDGSLTNVVIGTNVTYIGQEAFWGCSSLTSISIPDSVTSSIGDYTFLYCGGLTNVMIGTSVTSIGKDAFYYCSNLKSITIPDSVTGIGNSAFEGCSGLTNVVIGTSVTSIGSRAFQWCSSLEHVTIPDSVLFIGDLAFRGCLLENGIYFKGNAPSVGAGVFDSCDQAIVYYMLGTIGWGEIYAGRPTVLWNPLIQTDDGIFGVQAGTFGFNIAESESGLVMVKACTNLTDGIWTPVQTHSMSNSTVYFGDSSWTNHPSRVYQLSMP